MNDNKPPSKLPEGFKYHCNSNDLLKKAIDESNHLMMLKTRLVLGGTTLIAIGSVITLASLTLL
jgi:hypothetical protein